MAVVRRLVSSKQQRDLVRRKAACFVVQHHVQLGPDLDQGLTQQQVSLGKAVVQKRYMFTVSCLTFIKFLPVHACILCGHLMKAANELYHGSRQTFLRS